jgi:DNA-directed RNA polymerase specialized sigma24 family protein
LVKSYPMAAPAFSVSNHPAARLADPALREALLKFARRRLPPGEVDDLVQNTLADALAAPAVPSDEAELRRWLRGIARHKIADLFRRHGRLPPLDSGVETSSSDSGPATGELTQWIERELPKTKGAHATLRWLLRESDGETLDEIARDAALPAPRVRQRVSRLRRHFQTRWLALGAAGLSLLIGAGALCHAWRAAPTELPSIARETSAPLDRARTLRQSALEKCAAAEYPECLAQLDEAKALDPIGEDTSDVRDARNSAAHALASPTGPSAPAPAPAPAPHSFDSKTKPEPPVKTESSRPDPKPSAKPKQRAPSKKQAMPNRGPIPNQGADSPFGDQPAKSSGDRKTSVPSD